MFGELERVKKTAYWLIFQKSSDRESETMGTRVIFYPLPKKDLKQIRYLAIFSRGMGKERSRSNTNGQIKWDFSVCFCSIYFIKKNKKNHCLKWEKNIRLFSFFLYHPFRHKSRTLGSKCTMFCKKFYSFRNNLYVGQIRGFWGAIFLWDIYGGSKCVPYLYNKYGVTAIFVHPGLIAKVCTRIGWTYNTPGSHDLRKGEQGNAQYFFLREILRFSA